MIAAAKGSVPIELVTPISVFGVLIGRLTSLRLLMRRISGYFIQ
jgi:hypothetical protein